MNLLQREALHTGIFKVKYTSLQHFQHYLLNQHIQASAKFYHKLNTIQFMIDACIITHTMHASFKINVMK